VKPSFTRRLTVSYLFVVFVTLAFTGFYLNNRLRRDFMHQLEHSLGAQASLVAHSFLSDLGRQVPQSTLQQRVQHLGGVMGFRVTLVNTNGIVLADSDRTMSEVTRMDNHLKRPEIQSALRLGTGESVRESETLHKQMLYLAVPIRASPTGEGGILGVVRLALDTTEVDRRLSAFRHDLLKAGAAAIVVAILIALLSVRKISQPLRGLVRHAQEIGEGRYAAAPTVQSSDEFGRLAAAFSDMAQRVDEKVRELTRERSQLGAILGSLVEGVIALDHQGRILLLNAAAEALFQIKSTQAKGRPFLEVLRQSPLNEVLSDALSRREPLSREITLHSPHERILAVHARPVDYGEGTGVLTAFHDVTELRRLERIRQEFVANASHELKTPLTSIKGFAETLLDGAIDDPQNNRAFVQTIQEQADRLMRLIEDLLDLSAIEARRVNYRWEEIAPQDVADRVIQSLAPMAKAHSVRIDNELKEPLPKIRGDREKIAQILLNLLDNAIKFNKPGGYVRLSARRLPSGLEMSVEDTGPGIAAEDLPRVFERFFRGDRSHSQEIAGTGLGLAIVKHLVEAHQGSVQAESRLGQGSTFRFTLPFA
jgi:two-component system phosphate regulon sensor histidine kinase PhoR